MDILLVEDDDLVRDCLAEILRSDGFTVTAAPGAESALAACGNAAPLVAVSDIDLGEGMDGLALSGALRALWPMLPVVFISGRRWMEAQQLGPRDRFLPKPFRATALLQTVHWLISAPALAAPGLPALPASAPGLYRLPGR